MDTRPGVTLENLYQRYIQPLSSDEQLELIALISRQLARDIQVTRPASSIMALHGLGKEKRYGRA